MAAGNVPRDTDQCERRTLVPDFQAQPVQTGNEVMAAILKRAAERGETRDNIPPRVAALPFDLLRNTLLLSPGDEHAITEIVDQVFLPSSAGEPGRAWTARAAPEGQARRSRNITQMPARIVHAPATGPRQRLFNHSDHSSSACSSSRDPYTAVRDWRRLVPAVKGGPECPARGRPGRCALPADCPPARLNSPLVQRKRSPAGLR